MIIKFYIFILLLWLFGSCQSRIESFKKIDRLPAIFPDYAGITVPPNIAPLNFKINEPGDNYEVRLFSKNDNPIVIRNKNSNIQIDIDEWHALLKEGAGSNYYVEVFVHDEKNGWQKFKTIENIISNEPIDSHLAYRLINTGYVLWTSLGIYQRNLENFKEKPILENHSIDYGCINCHSFASNDPSKMMIHIRAINGGTLISDNGKLKKIDTKTKYTLNAGAYSSWHPDGKHIAYSVNNIGQFFCSGEIRIEVADEFSDLIVYDIEKNMVSTAPQVSTSSRENLPVWSPDGKYIYFISAPGSKQISDRIQAHYDLLRIGYNINTNEWGKVDTVLSSKEIGKSISFPKISPNGKYLMFCTSDNGYFTIHHPQTDLNLLDLKTGEFHKLDINSPETDSYHCFSSGGHWFVFSSKRIDGLHTRPFFSFLDEDGNASKPFVLPQKDPEFYATFIKNYNIPELIKGEVPYSQIQIRDEILKGSVPAIPDPRMDTIYMKKHLKEMSTN